MTLPETSACSPTASEARAWRTDGGTPRNAITGTASFAPKAEIEGEPGGAYKSFSQSKRRQLVNEYPLFVAWYCAVRQELTLKTLVVPVFGASNYVAVFDWAPTGGMVHLHYILWRSGAPRFDLQAERLLEKAKKLRKANLVSAAYGQTEKMDDILDFFERYVSE